METARNELLLRERIRELNEGNEEAFRAIYTQLHNKVYRFAYSLTKQTHQSEEVVQETFLKLWVHRREIDPGRSLDSLLFTIARRLVIDMIRNATSTAINRENWFRATQTLDHSTEESISASNLQDFVDNAVGNLPKQQQLIFRLSREEGMTHEEISRHLHISKNTVKNHLVAALRTLRRRLSEHDLISLFLLFFFGIN